MTSPIPTIDLEVYWASGSPMAWPVQLALKEKALPHRSTMVDLNRGETKTESYLAMNPRGKVPLLRDGERIIYESRAILDYLDWAYPDCPLTPTDADARVVDFIRKQETAYIYPAADAAISYTSYSSTLPRADWDLDRLSELSAPLVKEFSRWNGYLEDRTWLAAGPAPTQSDLLLIALVLYMRRFGFDYKGAGLHHLARYVEQALNRESVRQTWPPHWRTTSGDPSFAAATSPAG